jgi:hypothetical protein
VRSFGRVGRGSGLAIGEGEIRTFSVGVLWDSGGVRAWARSKGL